MTVGVDLIEIERVRRALERYAGFRDALLHRGRAGVLRLEAEPRPALRGAVRRQGGGRQGARLRRRVYFAWREIEIAGGRSRGVHSRGRTAAWAERVGAGEDRALDDALQELAAAVAVVSADDA